MEGEGKRGTTLRKISSSIFKILLAISSRGASTKLWISWAYKLIIWFCKIIDEDDTKGCAPRWWAHVNLALWYLLLLFYYSKEQKILVTKIGIAVLFISFIKKLKYWNLSIHSDQLYVLLNMCHAEQKFEETW